MTLVRSTIEGTVSLLGGMLSRRKVAIDTALPNGAVAVNLGCGLAVARGWINVDASLNALFAGAPRSVLRGLYRLSGANRYYTEEQYCELLSGHRFVFHDLARSLPFESETVDFFYSSHFFEHLFRKDALRLLREMRVALKKSGVVRIAVPDLAYSINLYHQGQKKKMLEDYFFVNDLESYLARHKYMYDFELLKGLLEEAGFQGVERCAFQSGATPDLVTLDNRRDETLYVEARR